MQSSALYVAAAIFLAMAVVHVVRLFTGFQVIIADITVPVSLSYVAAPVAALLAIWMFSAARRA